jgi:hypothetical protein
LNIDDCTIDCESITAGSATYPVIVGGGKTTINASKINIDTIGGAILGAGAFNSGHTVAQHEQYARDVIITNSNITINAQSASDKVYAGTGIFGRSLSIQNSTIEITASKAALAAGGTTLGTTIDGVTALVPEFVDGHTMYTELNGAAVTEYTTTAYFKVEPATPVVPEEPEKPEEPEEPEEPEVPSCEHTETTSTDSDVVPATCGQPGSKTVTVTCDGCGEVISTTKNVEIPATGNHTEEPFTGKGATCAEHYVDMGAVKPEYFGK